MSLLPRAAGGRRAQATTRKSGNLPTRLADSTFEDKGDAEGAALPGFWARGPYRLLPCSLAGEQGVFMCAAACAGSGAERSGARRRRSVTEDVQESYVHEPYVQ